MSKQLSTTLAMCQEIKLHETDDIERIVNVGDEVEISDPLVTFGMGDTGDKAVDNFLRAFQGTDFIDNAKRTVKAEHSGRVSMIKMYTNKSLDKLSPSLFKIVSDYFKKNRAKRKILDKYDGTSSVYKLGTLYSLPTEPLKTPTIKGINCDVLIEVFIEHDDEVSVGDKLADYGACKQVISEVIPDGLEPYSEFRPEESIDIFQAPSSVLKRMVPSLVVNAAGNKCLLELKRKCEEIWKS
jgi:DNA-directed RNA polymerase beta subunit